MFREDGCVMKTAVAVILFAFLMLAGCTVVTAPVEGQEVPGTVITEPTPELETPGVETLDIAYVPALLKEVAGGEQNYAVPTMSPEGERVVYRENWQKFKVYELDTDNELEVPLTYDYDAEYDVGEGRAYLTAPTSLVFYVAFNEKAGEAVGDLFLVGSDGSKLVRIKASEVLKIMGTAYAGADRVEFASISISSSGEKGAFLADAWTVDGNPLDQVIGITDRSAYVMLTQPNQFADEGVPVISANGERVIFKDGNSDLYVSDFSGQTIVKLSSSAGLGAISGNGEVVAFVKEIADASGEPGLFSISTDGSTTSALVGNTQISGITGVAVNNDGSEIAFTGTEADRDGPELYVFSASRGVLMRLTNFGGSAGLKDLAGTPDLSRLAFVAQTDEGNSVYVATR